MRNTILDACTMINLLRIDEEDFLFKSLMSIGYYVSTCVYDEIKQRMSFKDLDETRKKEIKFVIYKQIPMCLVYPDMEDKECENVKRLAKHKKKDNGELSSTYAALELSRKNCERFSFYTDDLKAKDELELVYLFHQSGDIRDSVDLLLYLYWISPDFYKSHLQNYLRKLKREYLLSLSDLVDYLKESDWERSKDKNFKRNVQRIINGYYSNDDKWWELVQLGIDYFANHEQYTRIKELLPKSNMETAHRLINKINVTLKLLEEYSPYKVVC